MSGLADRDRRTIEQARALAALVTPAAVGERFPGWGDDRLPGYVEAFTTARYVLSDLAAIAERLGEIRALLARFDWEQDDRQYALEAIERITEGGKPVNINTGQFEALTETAERVFELEERVSEMERMARDLVQVVRIFWDDGYQAAEESILGTRARTEVKPHPPRHLRSIGDDSP